MKITISITISIDNSNDDLLIANKTFINVCWLKEFSSLSEKEINEVANKFDMVAMGIAEMLEDAELIEIETF